MEKKCALISLIISVLVGISLYVESFDYNEVIVYTLLTFIIIYLICSVSSNFIYDIFRNAAKINRKEGAKYEKKVGSKYLRELPDYLTPALVSFIQDESIEYNKDVLAALLKLINDGYLKIENNKIVNTNKDYSNLYEHEKYLCDAIKNRTDVKFSEFKDNLIIDARLGFYAVPHSFKVYLKVELREAARRAYNDSLRKDTEIYNSIEDAMRDIKYRYDQENMRYLKTYNVKRDDMNNYDLVIDTTQKAPEEVANIILTQYREWLKERE